MTTVFLDDISMESDETIADAELFEQTRVVPDNPAYSQDYSDMDLVFATLSGVQQRGAVCRDDINQVAHLKDKYPSLKKLLQKYPAGSFTQDPSSMNYDVATEGMFSTAYNAVVKVLRDILTFIVRSFRRLWEFLNGNERRTVAIDNLADRVAAVQDYLINTNKIMDRDPGDYSKVRTGAIVGALNNVNKGWREIHTFFIEKAEDRNRALDVLTGTLKVNIPPFIAAVDTFLDQLAAAETEADVKQAVDTFGAVRLNNENVQSLAESYGYVRKDIKVDARMTPFQSTTSYINSYMKTLGTRHSQLTKDTFSEMVLTMTIDNWSEDILETIKWSAAKTGPILQRLEKFDENSLKPGLEAFYSKYLSVFFPIITSYVGAFTELEGALSQLVDARNEATLKIAEGGLSIAKTTDKWVLSNKAKLSVSTQSQIAKYRDNLRKLF